MLGDALDTWNTPDMAVRLCVSSPMAPEGTSNSSHVLVGDAVDQAMLLE